MGKRDKILVFTTGGTINKTYDERDGSLHVSENHINTYIFSKLRLPHTDIVLSAIMSKDSLDMTDKDRELVYKMIDNNLERKHPILVIHGTDTMEVTAEFCKTRIANPAVPIVFTGSMLPLAFVDSDGPQNISEALMACKCLSPGFYISFHNKVFSVPNVTKDHQRGTFIEKTST